MALGSWETSCESRRSRSADPGKSRRKVRPSVRVRVSGMGLVLVGSFLAFRVEALAASAGRPVVRVAHEEAAPRDAFRVVHARAIEVFLAVAVDEDLESVDRDDVVVLVDLPVEGEAVSEAGAAAARHVHPEIRILDGAQRLAGLWIGALDELLDFVRCGFGQGDLNHCATPHPPNTMTPLFNSLVVSCATPSISQGLLKRPPHVTALCAEAEALVDMARAGVYFRNLELDLPMAPPAGPIDRPFDEELPDPFASVRGADPDVVDEPVRLRRKKSALSDDYVPEQLAVRVLGDPLLRPVSLNIGFDLLSKVGFPFAPVEPRPFVLGDIVPDRLERRLPDYRVVFATRRSHPDVQGGTRHAAQHPVAMNMSSSIAP